MPKVLGSNPGWAIGTLSKITKFLFLIEDISELECWHLYKSLLSKEEGSGKYFPLPSSPKRTIVESTFHYPPLLEVSKRGRQFYVIGRMTWKSKQTNKRPLSEKIRKPNYASYIQSTFLQCIEISINYSVPSTYI